MNLRAQLLHIQAGGRNVAILDDASASYLGVHSSDRVKISYKNKHTVAIVNVAANFPRGSIGLYEEPAKKLGVEKEEDVKVELVTLPESLSYIQAKINNGRLRGNEIELIIRDVVEGV